MRTVIITGAVVCCIVGLFLSFKVLQEVIGRSPEFFHELGNFIGLFVAAAYVFLAFAPAIMLFQSRRSEKPRFGFILIGAIEFLVIGLFIAMLFPAL
jgi:cytochrome bd-type quinol oxidase subunit 2